MGGSKYVCGEYMLVTDMLVNGVISILVSRICAERSHELFFCRGRGSAIRRQG